jgi:hypothetical protein
MRAVRLTKPVGEVHQRARRECGFKLVREHPLPTHLGALAHGVFLALVMVTGLVLG